MKVATFNLIEEPWIPCTMLDGGRQTLGIQETLGEADRIGEIRGESPLVTAALHRLLIAILHRNLDIADTGSWGSLWERGGFDDGKLHAYFQRWRRRFDLFDDDRPFYQTAGLDPAKGGSSARLFFHQDNNATLFTHLAEADPPELSPAEAARWLLAFMSFDIGGTKTAENGPTSAKAALLNKGAVVLALGDSLFQTLMLNLCRYAPEEGDPWDFDRNDDAPAWEQDEDTRPAERRPDGYVDLLTWQSRRIRLEPRESPAGDTVVRKVVIMDGFRVPDDILHEMETMLAFRRNPRAKDNVQPWIAVSFTEGKALWRDSLALLQSIGGDVAPPKTIQWLGDLVSEGILPHSRIIPVDVLGLCSSRAKVLFWRHERLPIPTVYLYDGDLAESLQDALELTETTAGHLNRTMTGMARDLLGIKGDRPRKAESNRMREITQHLGAERAYWSRLETPFKLLLANLPNDLNEHGDYGEHSLPAWKVVLRSAVMTAFEESTRGMDRSTRNLKALAHAEGSLRRVTYRHLSPHEETVDHDLEE